jgi:hypothetical protein
MLYRYRSATPISPMVGLLGAIAVIALLVLGTLAFHGSSNGTPVSIDWVGVPKDVPGTQPVPR